MTPQIDQENIPGGSSQVVVQLDRANSFRTPSTARGRLFIDMTNWESQSTRFALFKLVQMGER